MRLYFFLRSSEIRYHLCTIVWGTAVEDHLRSVILVAIERKCATFILA